MVGASTGSGNANSAGAQLNVAVAGAIAQYVCSVYINLAACVAKTKCKNVFFEIVVKTIRDRFYYCWY